MYLNILAAALNVPMLFAHIFRRFGTKKSFFESFNQLSEQFCLLFELLFFILFSFTHLMLLLL
jgi:hypothetical protein